MGGVEVMQSHGDKLTRKVNVDQLLRVYTAELSETRANAVVARDTLMRMRTSDTDW